MEKGTYPCKGFIICSILTLSVGGTKEDFRAVLVVVSVENLIRITLYKQGGRAMFDKEYD